MIAGLSALFLGFQAEATLMPVADLLDCARKADATLVATHRAGGFAPGIPENSIAGIRRSAEMGAAFAEIDLRRTSDGEIVLMHDATLERTTTGTGEVSNRTLAEIRQFYLVDAAGRRTVDRIPTLSEAFAAAEAAGLYLELDLKGIAVEYAAQLAVDAGIEDRVVIIVNTTEDAAAIQSVSPHIGISIPFTDREVVLNSELDFGPLLAWAGYGIPDARTEAFLTGQQIETAMHDFPGEADGTVDYAFIDQMHVEVLASDNPEAALHVFGRWDAYCQ
ncbi:MAG: glycerophosphoryl diester phosphodiesterase [Hyphobacterium sp.]|nr:MAG: glycerophosphoryl diester phosphodiesterase [Hyphobacterium sp.]